MELRGKIVTLRPPTPADYAALGRILNDRLTMEHLIKFFGHDKWTEEQVRERYESFEAQRWKGAALNLVVQLPSLSVVGNAGFRTIDPAAKEAEFGLILHQSVWGKSVAAECHLLVLRHGFEVMDLENVFFTTDETNLRMQGFFKKIHIPQTKRLEGGQLRYDLSRVLWPQVRKALEERLKRP